MTGTRLRINAWTGQAAPASELGPDWRTWSKDQHMQNSLPTLDSEGPPELRDYRNKKVGWGVILPDRKLGVAALARGDDAPQPIRDLIKARKGVVLRYRKDLLPDKIRRYYAKGKPNVQDLDVIRSD